MKMSVLIYFSISILFINELRAKESHQLFINAVKGLRADLSSYGYESESPNPFKESVLLNQKERKGSKVFLDDPLRSASLEDYKLKGLVWETNTPKAIIKDTLGKSHILKKGDYLGDNQGQIIQIREGEVVVLELVEKEDGEGSMYKTQVLTFSDSYLSGKEKKKNR